MTDAIIVMFAMGAAWGFVSFCASVVKTILFVADWLVGRQTRAGDTFWHEWMDVEK